VHWISILAGMEDGEGMELYLDFVFGIGEQPEQARGLAWFGLSWSLMVAPVITGGHSIADGASPFVATDAALVDGACQLAASTTNQWRRGQCHGGGAATTRRLAHY
jgi:hypothetical protein